MNVTKPAWLKACRCLSARGCPSRSTFADKTALRILSDSLASKLLRVKHPRA